MMGEKARRSAENRPTSNPRARHAFTLVELLAVISILALLVAMLTPYLTKAREVAKRAICMQNHKSIATAVQGFAADHRGRSPGGGGTSNNSCTGWAGVLNVEWYHSTWGLQPIISVNNMPRKESLTCPSFRTYGGWFNSNVYSYNRDIEGETINAAHAGPYTLSMDPQNVNYLYQQLWGVNLTNYYLGALLLKIVRPTSVYMLIESEYNGNTDTFNTNGATGGPAQLNVSTPQWATSHLETSYRHCLPPDPALYSEQASAVFSYADCHVSVVYANTPYLLDWDHFVTDGVRPGS